MNYRTVFEVTDKGFELITLMPLLFIVIGIGISWFNIKYNKSESIKKKFTIVFGFIISGFAFFLLMLIVPSSLADRSKTRRIFKNKDHEVIEGKIENFHPMPYSGHDVESFTVNGVYFEYSDYILSYGFNQTSSHNGPLRENGQEVRLSYISEDGENRILKIEVKE